jgi:hypothetical protein
MFTKSHNSDETLPDHDGPDQIVARRSPVVGHFGCLEGLILQRSTVTRRGMGRQGFGQN